MGVRNYLIEGVSGSGKTAVAEELQRRGHHVVHGDRELAYHGDPLTGEPLKRPARAGAAWRHQHWIWDIDKVRCLAADPSHAQSFFCGGLRNHRALIGLFDAVFVLDIDTETLNARLAARPQDEFGGQVSERRLIERLRATQDDIPKNAIRIDATAPLPRVVDAILSRCRAADRRAD